MSADQGFPQANFDLGCSYSEGMGVPKNKATAIEYFKVAAEGGYVPAMCNLGYAYSRGADGVPKNTSLAFKYYRMGADKGHAESQFQLGLLCRDQNHDQVHQELWFKYTKLAADQGHPGALHILATLYRDGIGVEANEQLSQKYSKLAAAQGLSAENRDNWKDVFNAHMKKEQGYGPGQ